MNHDATAKLGKDFLNIKVVNLWNNLPTDATDFSSLHRSLLVSNYRLFNEFLYIKFYLMSTLS